MQHYIRKAFLARFVAEEWFSFFQCDVAELIYTQLFDLTMISQTEVLEVLRLYTHSATFFNHT